MTTPRTDRDGHQLPEFLPEWFRKGSKLFVEKGSREYSVLKNTKWLITDVIYDPEKQEGERVVKAFVRCINKTLGNKLIRVRKRDFHEGRTDFKAGVGTTVGATLEFSLYP